MKYIVSYLILTQIVSSYPIFYHKLVQIAAYGKRSLRQMRLSETFQRQLATDKIDIYLQIMKSSVQPTAQRAALIFVFSSNHVADVPIVINHEKFSIYVKFIIEIDIKLVG